MSYSIVKLNSARNCLRYVIKAFNIKEIHIPYYLCPAIRLSLSKEKCKVNFYHLDENFYPTSTFKEDDYILYPNYFGICSQNANKLSKIYKNLIVDNAHLYTNEQYGIAGFNSLRKIFPTLRNGAFLYTNKAIDIDFPIDEYMYDSKLLNYEQICRNEDMIDFEDIKKMSLCTENLLNSISIENIKNLRHNQFFEFHNKYGTSNLLKIELVKNEIPFLYPILFEKIEEAETIVFELKKQGKIIYRYWHNLPCSFIEKDFYEKLVAIPLD